MFFLVAVCLKAGKAKIFNNFSTIYQGILEFFKSFKHFLCLLKTQKNLWANQAQRF
ncbi:hypothetical protein [Campylobacter sp.]|uniref:hypothetical protein n=1 Tax=Campylobacter sp. TaxID=205 RepID=UPI002AA7636E|nr:hypothetical protein [Campylobacter sp.]